MGLCCPTNRCLAALLVLCLLSVSTCTAANTRPKVLVLLDSLSMQETHSKFLQNLNAKEFDVTVAAIDTGSIQLRQWDEWLFDRLVIIGGSKSRLGPGVKSSTILNFFNSGHDVFLALDASSTTQLRDLAISLGVDVAPSGNLVIDHFNFNPTLAEDHTAVTTASISPLPPLFGRTPPQGRIAYRGIALSLSSDTEVAMHVAVAEGTAYSGPVSKPAPSNRVPLAGANVGLISIVQGRNNARATVIGSTLFLSNAFFTASPLNARVAADVLRWTFQLRGVLRVSPLRHRRVVGNDGGDVEVSPAVYRINDEVEVAVDVEECTDGVCAPFKPTDMQIEFVMLDPYVRATLVPVPNSSNGTLSAQVKVPDAYGVFKWVLEYKRPGYSWVSDVITVPVRPYRHHEYDRFIVQAYPYYASTAAMMGGFFVLGFYFLYTEEDGGAKGKKQA